MGTVQLRKPGTAGENIWENVAVVSVRALLSVHFVGCETDNQ